MVFTLSQNCKRTNGFEQLVMNTDQHAVADMTASAHSGPDSSPDDSHASASQRSWETPRSGAMAPPVVPAKRSEFLNRLLNVLIALMALVILAPVMLLIALAIKLTSQGRVFYVQDRVGVDRRRRAVQPGQDRRRANVGGRPFRILKFRSMRNDAEAGTGAVWAKKQDPRVTPVGNFLRTTRLDELPQLINVVLGDMNIVGPRPERPSIFAELRQNIDGYQLRQQARPGITGWAQINHSYDTSIEDVRVKIQLDLEYLARQSLAEDLKIMMRTLPVMIFKRGAQ